MDAFDDIYDDELVEVENMRNQRKKLESKDFAKLINKKDISSFEMDELFM